MVYRQAGGSTAAKGPLLRLIFTRSTLASAVAFLPDEVVAAELVATGAMCCLRLNASLVVDLPGNSLKVGRVAARSRSAQMIYLQTVRYFTDECRVGVAVNEPDVSAPERRHPVALVVPPSRPHPAGARDCNSGDDFDADLGTDTRGQRAQVRAHADASSAIEKASTSDSAKR